MSDAVYFGRDPDEKHLAKERQRNNPENKPVGHFTGRCKKCGSKNLWDDNLTYGCKNCGAIYFCN
jgi:uncharacterized protein (DUF983 family)